MDAREGVEPSIVLLQRTVLPFDHPAIVRAFTLLGRMHPLASVPTDYCTGLLGFSFTTALIISHFTQKSRGKIIFLGVDTDTHLAYNDPVYEN